MSEPLEHTAYTTGTVAFQEKNRQVYQYSVIPGGVYSGAELDRARRTDPVVSEHYSDFGPDTRVSRLSQDELVYISYRKADKVFWSQKKHRVCAGEAVVTDGKNMARSRCGNRLSKVPKLPTAKTEPSDALLNTPDVPASDPGVQTGAGGPLDMASLPSPVDPGTSLLGGGNSPASPVTTGGSSPQVPATTGANGAGSNSGAPAYFPAIGPYFGPGGGILVPGTGTTTGTSTGGTTTGTTTGSGTTDTTVPEPSYGMVVASLCLMITGAFKRKSMKHSERA